MGPMARATWEFLTRRKQSYKATFNRDNPAAMKVLDDLAKFCRAHKTTSSEDPNVSALMEGRREVWLRIQHSLQMTDDQLWDHYTGGQSKDN